MNVTVYIAIAAFLLSLYATYDLIYRRVQARKKLFTDADRAVVTSAVELIEPYRARVRELVEHVSELQAQLQDAHQQIGRLTDEVKDLRHQVGAMRTTMEE